MSRSTNRNRGDSIVPTRKRQDETNDVQIEIEKGKEKKKPMIKKQQERKKGVTSTGCQINNAHVTPLVLPAFRWHWSPSLL